MSFWSKLFGGSSKAAASEGDSTSSQWKCVLVPAVEQPYSMRGLQVAYRLAQGSNATVQLAFIIEVPRTLLLDAAMPFAETIAADALAAAQEAAIPYKVQVEPTVHRTRNARDRILSLVTEEKADLLVLGSRPDGLRGLPRDMTRDLFQNAPCEVVVDYIANEK